MQRVRSLNPIVLSGTIVITLAVVLALLAGVVLGKGVDPSASPAVPSVPAVTPKPSAPAATPEPSTPAATPVPIAPTATPKPATTPKPAKPAVTPKPAKPAKPAVTPKPVPPAKPTPTPPDDLPEGVEIVQLENPGGFDSSVAIWDETDSLAGASSSTPEDGATVGQNEIGIEHIDDDTVRLTWLELPRDSKSRLSIRITDDGIFELVLFRTAPHGPTDDSSTDRSLILDFHVAVSDYIDAKVIVTADDNG